MTNQKIRTKNLKMQLKWFAYTVANTQKSNIKISKLFTFLEGRNQL